MILPDKIKLNEIQFTSDSGDVLFNSKFIFDIQQNITYLTTQFEQIKQDYKNTLNEQRKEIIDQVIDFIQNHTYETLKVENLKFKSGMILNSSEIHNIKNSLRKYSKS